MADQFTMAIRRQVSADPLEALGRVDHWFLKEVMAFLASHACYCILLSPCAAPRPLLSLSQPSRISSCQSRQLSLFEIVEDPVQVESFKGEKHNCS